MKEFTVGKNYLLGLSVQIMPGSDQKMYLTAVIWYPRRVAGRWYLGYLYPSIRWFGENLIHS